MAEKAIDLFNQVENPDEILINLLFNSCAHLKTKEALDLAKQVSQQMPQSFYSNPRLLTSLFDAMIKCGDTSNAEILFSKMTKSAENYGNLMSGFNEESNFEKTLRLFHQMTTDSVEADPVTYLLVLKALSRIGDYSLAQSIVKQTPHSFLLDNRIQTTLVDMWV